MLGFIFSILDPLVYYACNFVTTVFDRYNAPAKRSEEPDDTLSNCRYRIDDSTTSTFTLPDKRILGYATFGSTSPDAHTIFKCHGWPASRTEGTFLEEAAKRLNVKLICIDRPGLGLSSPNPKGTILSHVEDMKCLTDHLKLKRYGVLGVSGGGPYALACAYALPADKLKVVSIVCGLGPADIGYKGMFFMNYLGWTYGAHCTPLMLKWFFSREPGCRMDLGDKGRLELMIKDFEKQRPKMDPRDAKCLGDIDFMKAHLKRSNDVLAQGWDGAFRDMKLLASDPGFRVEDIRKDLKVKLLYGRLDGNVPLNHGIQVAKRIGDNAELTILEDETHASIYLEHRDEFLAEMVKCM